ncbi:glycosyltransferase family 9 protein [Streptomyces sp. GSL17-111]|uniref:glycosyltransferase family 9 protein n=1 Tax=Streptomyces sp. GSL17-111 TaxID=3121596 RepID=UPI0030F47784
MSDRPRARPRLLVLRALGLGDLLTAVPALTALRRAHPAHEVVLAAPAGLREAARATGVVDRLLPAAAPGRAVPPTLTWEGRPPELAVDLHGTGPESQDLLRTVRPARLLAYAAPDGPPPAVAEHERERWCRLLRWHGVPADADEVRLPRPTGPSPAPGAVVLHPGAAAGSRCWPPERFAEVAAAVRAAGRPVVVTAGPGEERLAARVAVLAGLPDDTVRSGMPFDVLSALVAGAGAVVSGDTGVAHLAVAHGTASVTLFGPVPPSEWGPPARARHRVLWHPGPRGDPHGDRPDPLLLRVRPAEVLAALTALTAHGPLDAPEEPPDDPQEMACPAAVPGPPRTDVPTRPTTSGDATSARRSPGPPAPGSAWPSPPVTGRTASPGR